MSKIHFFIITCSKYLLSRGNIVRQTWLPRLIQDGYTYNFVVGIPTLKEESRIEGDILYLKCDDGYWSLPEKTFKMIQYAQSLNVDGLIKVDDDVVVNFDNFNLKLSQFLEHQYVGKPSYTRGEDFNVYNPKPKVEWRGIYYGGPFYFIHKSSFSRIFNVLSTTKMYQVESFEDKMIGDVFTTLGYRNKVLPFFSLLLIGGSNTFETYDNCIAVVNLYSTVDQNAAIYKRYFDRKVEVPTTKQSNIQTISGSTYFIAQPSVKETPIVIPTETPQVEVILPGKQETHRKFGGLILKYNT